MLSSILTWNLWTYQPNVEEFEKKSTIKEVMLSSPKEIKEIVKIDQVLFTMDEKYYGTVSSEKINLVMNEISNLEFNAFTRIPPHQVNPNAITRQHDSVLIQYPSDISTKLFSTIYKLTGEFPAFHFNQILIDFEHSHGQDGVVYFISQENDEIYSSNVSLSSIHYFENALLNEVKDYAQYFPLTLETGKTIYLPEGETELVFNQYLIKNNVDADQLKNALFSDPSLVQKSIISNVEEYTDGQNLLREDNDNHMIMYINPSEDENNDTPNDNNLIQKSIDFVNDHGGWTDQYRYFELNKERDTVHFRMYGPDGYPVFSENSRISTLEVGWISSEVSRYNRNNFSLGQLAINQIKKLDSGRVALEKIKAQEAFNPEKLQDIKIGYKINLNAQTRLVSLEPSWFYLYEDKWVPLAESEIGGDEVGLE